MIAYIGLGSNVGDRLANLRAARDRLTRPGVRVIASSSVYETAPQGEVLDQPDFMNACVKVETDLAPEELLDVCKEIERELGRELGGPRHGPRPADLDLLVLGDAQHRSPRLRVPHPELLERRFALEPLVELDPDLMLPGGALAADALARLAHQRVVRVAEL